MTKQSDESEPSPPSSLGEARAARLESRRLEALSLYLAGISTDVIAQRLGIEPDSVHDLVVRTLKREDPQVDFRRSIENARIDRAQTAIWNQVLEGDLKAIDTWLRLSARRSRLNGMDAPTRIELDVTVRQEMEQALRELENVILGEVIEVADEQSRESERPAYPALDARRDADADRRVQGDGGSSN